MNESTVGELVGMITLEERVTTSLERIAKSLEILAAAVSLPSEKGGGAYIRTRTSESRRRG